MSHSTSSAVPAKLQTYSNVACNLDADIDADAGRLSSVLARFETSCNDPSFRLTASHASSDMSRFANDARPTDEWVAKVGTGFLLADGGSLASAAPQINSVTIETDKLPGLDDKWVKPLVDFFLGRQNPKPPKPAPHRERVLDAPDTKKGTGIPIDDMYGLDPKHFKLPDWLQKILHRKPNRETDFVTDRSNLSLPAIPWWDQIKEHAYDNHVGILTGAFMGGAIVNALPDYLELGKAGKAWWQLRETLPPDKAHTYFRVKGPASIKQEYFGLSKYASKFKPTPSNYWSATTHSVRAGIKESFNLKTWSGRFSALAYITDGIENTFENRREYKGDTSKIVVGTTVDTALDVGANIGGAALGKLAVGGAITLLAAATGVAISPGLLAVLVVAGGIAGSIAMKKYIVDADWFRIDEWATDNIDNAVEGTQDFVEKSLDGAANRVADLFA